MTTVTYTGVTTITGLTPIAFSTLGRRQTGVAVAFAYWWWSRLLLRTELIAEGLGRNIASAIPTTDAGVVKWFAAHAFITLIYW